MLRIDAAFELVLAIVLAVTAAGLFGSDDWRRPTWVGAPALTVGAVALLIAAVALYVLSSVESRAVLAAVAAANGVTAVGAALWATLDDGFGGEFRFLLFLTAAGLLVLSAAQAVSCGNRRTVPVNPA